MAKNRRNKRTGKEKLSPFPPAGDPPAALEWWRDKIRSGFPPIGAADNLCELAGQADDPVLSGQFQALERVVGDMVQPAFGLSGAPRAVNHLTASADRTRMFISSATGGITCHELPGGRRLWAIPAERAFQVGGMALWEDVLYYTDSWRGTLNAVGTSDGAELWSAAAASDGAPLLAPAGLAVMQCEGTPRLMVADSAAHRLCTFATNGEPLAVVGTRGLVDEEITHLNTAPRGTAIQPYFEFPRAVSIAADGDGETALFVWDSGNCRVVVLDSGFNRKRQVLLEAEKSVKPRLAGQVLVVSGVSGPVILVVDDAARTLAVRGSSGELLLAIDLAPLVASPNRIMESFRLESGGHGSGEMPLAAGNRKIFRLGSSLLHSSAVAADLLTVFPGDCRLVLTAASSGSGNGNRIESWGQVSPTLDPSALVRSLLNRDGLLTGDSASAADKLAGLATRLDSFSLNEEATTLRQALSSQLEELRTSCLDELERLSAPSPGKIADWSDALSEVDMELFQSRGRLSSAELAMDSQLEQIRELRPSIRRIGWRLHAVHSLLAAERDRSLARKYLDEMLVMLDRVLDRRIDILASVASKLEYDRDPQRIKRQELQAAHAARLEVSAIEGAAVALAGELACLSWEFNSGSDNEYSARLSGCLEKSAGLDCYDTLAGIAGGKKKPLDLTAAIKPDKSAGKTLAILVDNMGSYLEQVRGSENGGNFGKVIERQKNLFAVKASVLANYFVANGRGRELLERARRMSGEAWIENRNLRPAALEVEDQP